ncbi:ubiquitin-like protein 7 [Monomorium pharaonis]|uniref:ubiquitin-like protein 7 n=1 Tax=Monomorium pharaonis TaxID=307658 RepID=UPI00063EE061|nr:ubiquitin-like protein 7 [Monomorium pharaonis]
MITMELMFGVQINSEMVMPITLSGVNLKTKVETLKEEAAKKWNLPKDSFEFIYCGLILEDDATVESIGLKNGSMVHALQKKEPESSILNKPVSEDCILQLASAFKSFYETPTFRLALHRLSKRPEVIDNIVSSSPGLHEDAVAIAMLQDPDLMAHFIDVNTVRRIAKLHPVLIEAAQNIAAAVHEEAHNAASSGSSSSSVASSQPATARSYSVDSMSLEEEMARDIAHFFATQPINDSNLRFHNMPPTAAANSQATSQRPDINPLPSSTSDGVAHQLAADNQSTGVITSQMFMEAMRQAALATSGNPNPQQAVAASPAATSLSPVLPLFSPPINDLQRQLAQMHEMGLQDDTINIQALQFTNGDVQAAIELVFSGFYDN